MSPNSLWVSDITYIDTEDGFCYLHLVTDAYSRKIIGWSLSPTLEAKYTVNALRMAIAQTGRDDLQGLIHHSDRGIQYCCDAYVGELNRHHISISMTEDYKPTDNAIAERVNGTIKTEVVYREKRYRNMKEACSRIGRYIAFYNDQRPHYSLGMQVPAQVHGQRQ
jgi:transposase InsO family protein